MRMREFINIIEAGFMSQVQQPAFGRKGVPEAPRKMPPPAHMQDEVSNASQYATADEYADANTWAIQPRNTDPLHMHTRYANERKPHIDKWNYFQKNGWL